MTIETILYWIFWTLGHLWIITITIVSIRLAYYNFLSFIRGFNSACKRYKIKPTDSVTFSDTKRVFRAAFRYLCHNNKKDFAHAIDFSFLYPSRWRAAYNRFLNKSNKK